MTVDEYDGKFFIVQMTRVGRKAVIGKATKDWKHYFHFRIEKDGARAVTGINTVFRDYKHMAGVFGKFNPYTRMIEHPPHCRLNYDDLFKVKSRDIEADEN